MPDSTDKPSSTASPSVECGDANASRRRLLQGGLAAAPVLMTLVSRPVLAGTRCTTPSGFVSANASTAGRGVTCNGRSHGFWKQGDASTNKWPSPYQSLAPPPNTSFNTAFTPPYAPFTGKTLLDVVNLTGGPPNNVARDVVAALLNVQAGLTPVLSMSTVKDIWSEFITTGFFSPSSGVQWNADEIATYLETTFS